MNQRLKLMLAGLVAIFLLIMEIIFPTINSGYGNMVDIVIILGIIIYAAYLLNKKQ